MLSDEKYLFLKLIIHYLSYRYLFPLDSQNELKKGMAITILILFTLKVKCKRQTLEFGL